MFKILSEYLKFSPKFCKWLNTCSKAFKLQMASNDCLGL